MEGGWMALRLPRDESLSTLALAWYVQRQHEERKDDEQTSSSAARKVRGHAKPQHMMRVAT
eukprot:scaffold1954_cov268-Pinguiococcus_pyrenoidosus.AAC.100